MIDGNKKNNINWLFVALVGASVVIHAGIFLQMSGLVDFKKTSYIPVSIRKDMKAPARAVPRLPARQPVPASRKPQPGVVPDHTVPSIAPVPESSDLIKPFEIAPPETLTPESVQDAKVAEDAPTEVPSDVNSKDSASSRPETAEDGGVNSRMEYFDAVRLKIENHKQYPAISRQQHMEGQVIVEFVINPDGGVSGLTVVSGSGFSVLDTAAMAAVTRAAPFSPLPEKYFSGPVQVKVPIAFELVR
ncbi:MAG: energy transducer TonB [Desulfobacteraceae bacterium]|nr:MAG: energy transducer TonB [Desulfobacteraceae bacterium]